MPEVPALHAWDLDVTRARQLQEELAGRVVVDRPVPLVRTVAGADVSFDLRGRWLHAAFVVVRAGTSEVIERSGVVAEVGFPYVPGLLTFREAPPLLQAYRDLKTIPDVVFVDGQGIAHPRRIGEASHLGLWLGIPTIGCAKSWLLGEHEQPGPNRGDWTPLRDKGEVIGAVLRTRDRVKPLYVSPGHLCDLASAIRIVLENTPQYRLPVPARLVHEYVNDLRRARGGGKE
jgi:deoxyribonuclease V